MNNSQQFIFSTGNSELLPSRVIGFAMLLLGAKQVHYDMPRDVEVANESVRTIGLKIL